ncbi:hypothetical protein [Paenibacillus sp. SN-8-1]|uniref:hypothetical protein n=1 Tax=Paenibacillus sp. SN-8-1 TaxID=3435409 RepID=UPI003D9A9FA9
MDIEGKDPNNYPDLNELREVGRTGTNITSFTDYKYRDDNTFADIRGKSMKTVKNIGDVKLKRMIVIDGDINTKRKSVYTSMFLSKARNLPDDYLVFTDNIVTLSGSIPDFYTLRSVFSTPALGFVQWKTQL